MCPVWVWQKWHQPVFTLLVWSVNLFRSMFQHIGFYACSVLFCIRKEASWKPLEIHGGFLHALLFCFSRWCPQQIGYHKGSKKDTIPPWLPPAKTRVPMPKVVIGAPCRMQHSRDWTEFTSTVTEHLVCAIHTNHPPCYHNLKIKSFDKVYCYWGVVKLYALFKECRGMWYDNNRCEGL